MRQNRAVVASLFKKNAFAPSVSNKKRNNDVRTNKYHGAYEEEDALRPNISGFKLYEYKNIGKP